MEAGTAERKDVRQVGGEGAAPGDVPESVKAAADARDPQRLSQEAQMDALDWLLSDEPQDGEDYAIRNLQINVGTPQQERWVTWTIRNVDREVLRSIQRQAAGTRAQRRGNAPVDVDPEQANLRIVVRGTVDPDLDKAVEAAVKKGAVQAGSPDPDWAKMQILRHRFRNKPGLIDQLAGEIFDLSGYDEGAIREAQEVKAAGN